MGVFTGFANWITADRATVGVAGLALLVSVATWLTSRKAARSAKSQAKSAGISAKAAVDSVAVAQGAATSAGESAAATKGQAEVSRHQLELAVQQIEHAQMVHRESVEPYVIMDISPSLLKPWVLELNIENIGPTVAKNVRITVDPPLVRSGEESDSPDSIRNWEVFTSGIPSLPPRRRITTVFDTTISVFADDSDLPTRYTVTVDAEGPFGDVPTATYVIDLKVLGFRYSQPKTTEHVVKALEELKREVSALTRLLNDVASRPVSRRTLFLRDARRRGIGRKNSRQ